MIYNQLFLLDFIVEIFKFNGMKIKKASDNDITFFLCIKNNSSFEYEIIH